MKVIPACCLSRPEVCPKGMAAAYDTNGAETSDLIHNGWPRRPGGNPREPLPREFGTTATNIGMGVPCHVAHGYKAPELPAGGSKRISAFYKKTGVLAHRAEAGFRDTKAECTLTEVHPDFHYGTMRQPTRRTMGSTGSMVLRAPSPAQSMRSNRSRASQASQASRASRASSQASRARSESLHGSSKAPSWYDGPPPTPWNFDALPMYARTNESYGVGTRANFRGSDHRAMPAAGKSESGWLEPGELISTLTRPHHA